MPAGFFSGEWSRLSVFSKDDRTRIGIVFILLDTAVASSGAAFQIYLQKKGGDKKMKNIKNYALPAFAFALVVASAVTSSPVHAAADAALGDAIASSTNMFTDNKGQILTYITTMVGYTTLFALAVAALYWGKGQILSLMKKRKGRRK